jgi:hypothetical protein
MPPYNRKPWTLCPGASVKIGRALALGLFGAKCIASVGKSVGATGLAEQQISIYLLLPIKVALVRRITIFFKNRNIKPNV